VPRDALLDGSRPRNGIATEVCEEGTRSPAIKFCGRALGAAAGLGVCVLCVVLILYRAVCAGGERRRRDHPWPEAPRPRPRPASQVSSRVPWAVKRRPKPEACELATDCGNCVWVCDDRDVALGSWWLMEQSGMADDWSLTLSPHSKFGALSKSYPRGSRLSRAGRGAACAVSGCQPVSVTHWMDSLSHSLHTSPSRLSSLYPLRSPV